MAAATQKLGRHPTGGWLLAVGVLLIGMAAWFLFGGDEDTVAELRSVADAGPAAETATLRVMDGASADGTSALGPTLVGHTRRPPGPAPRAAVTVKVVGLGGRPLVGVRVELLPVTAAADPASAASRFEITDAHGEVVFADVALDGSEAARLLVKAKDVGIRIGSASRPGSKRRWRDRDRAGAWLPIRQSRVTLAPGRGVQLRIDPRALGGDQPIVMTVESPLPCFLGASTPERRTDEDFVVALAPARPYTIEYTLRRGDKGPPISIAHKGRLHPQATALLARTPVLEDARVVLLLDELPGEVRGGAITWLWSRNTGPLRPTRVRADALGRRQVEGIPFEAGEIVRVFGRVGRYTVRATGILGFDPQGVLVLRGSFARGPKQSALTERQLILHLLDAQNHWKGVRLRHGEFVVTGLRVEVRRRPANSLVVSPGRGPGTLVNLDDVVNTRRPGPSPVFEVRCFFPSGEPAAGARLTFTGSRGEAYADSLGVARLTNLLPGRCAVLVWGAGAPQFVSFEVPASRTGVLEVRGILGGIVDVEVVDAQDRPLPYAKITIRQASGLPWADIDSSAPKGGEVVQRIDPYVDADGRRRCHGVQPGYVTITASYGTRTVPLTVKVLAGRTVGARIVLPVFTLKPAPKKKGEPSPGAEAESARR